MTAVNAADVTTKRSFLDVWVITLGHTMTHWYPATFYLLLPLIGNELGLNYSEIGAILTCQYLVGAISNVPGGLVVDMIGRKTLLMALSLLWVGVPYLLMGFTHAYWLILVCSALIGIGNNSGIRLQFRSWRSGFPIAADSQWRFTAWAATSVIPWRRLPRAYC